MKYLLKYWLLTMALLAVLALLYLVFNWTALSLTHKLSFAVMITIVLHVLEEERFPGGFGYLFNVVRAKSDVPDRYPMNPLIAMTVDVVVILILFVPALFFPNVYWLGMAPMFLAILEFLLHAGMGIFLQWRGMHISVYNPGLATAILLAGISVWYIIIVISNNLISSIDWLWAILYFIAAILVGLVGPEVGLRSKTTPWAFDHEYFLGFYKRYTTLEEVFGRNAVPGGDANWAA